MVKETVTRGQIYEDNDFRTKTRFVEVLDFEGIYAICMRGNRVVRIQTKRLQDTSSRGYTLSERSQK